MSLSCAFNHILLRLAVCLLAFTQFPTQAQERLDSFATRLPIVAEGAQPYYRLSVPLQAYLASAHGDLRDLRVFNASGQAVPHARLAVGGSTEQSLQRTALKWFPLRAAAGTAPNRTAGDGSLNVVVKQAGDGTLVEINSQHTTAKPAAASSGGAEAPLAGYLLDASQVAERQAVRALELDWASPAGDFQLLDVESSDDLQHWHRLASNVQLARLDYNGARIEKRRIDLAGFSDRYLRLLWRAPATAPTLTGAELEASRSRFFSAPLAWSAPLAAGSGEADLKPGEYRFRLAQPLPIARLRVELPAGNQLLPVEVLTSGRDRRYWSPLASSVVYRISNQGREWSNAEIPLAGHPLKEFVLRLDPRLNPFSHGPQLAFAVQPAQLIFLASGQGPYTLAIGNKEAQDAALAPATLVPGFGKPGSPEIAAARMAEGSVQAPSQADGVGVAAAPAEKRDWKKIALWAVLVLGVLGMAAMAWQLLGQMKKTGGEG